MAQLGRRSERRECQSVARNPSVPDVVISKASFDHLRLLVLGDIYGGRSASDVTNIDVK